MDKMVMIVYNEAIESDVMELLAANNIKNHTRIPAVFGRGETSGTHGGDDVWPGRNCILYVACESGVARHVMNSIREARKQLGAEGLKAFLMPLEETT
jgi:hypothetical protein